MPVLQQVFKENSTHTLDEQGVPSYVSSHPLVRHMFWRRLQITARAVLDGAHENILDFGCGAGAFLAFLSANAKSVYAYDQDPRALDGAKKLIQSIDINNIRLLTTFSELRGLPSKNLDTITALDVLEHVDDLPALLKVFIDKLNPKGRLIVCSPTEYWYYRLARRFAGEGYQGEYHVRAADDVEAVLAEHFKIQVIGKVFPLFQFFRIVEATM